MKPITVLEMIDKSFLGGGQVALLSLARGLDRERFQVSAVSEEGGSLVDELKKSGIPHFPVSLGKMSGPAAVRRINALLKETKTDLLHTHGGVAGFYGRWAAKRAGTPAVIHTLHGIHYLHYRNALWRRAFVLLERRLSHFTDAVIFVSESDLEQGIRRRLVPPAKARLIRNGVEAAASAEFDAEAEKIILGAVKGPLIAAVSRLHRQKGVVYLLRAVPFIRKAYPDAKIVVAGGGPLEKILAGEIRKLGIEANAVLLGERKDARRIIAAADVFVLPSLWEGLPYVLIEAAALGKPIVATEIGGVKEVIHDGETGLLVPPKNPGKLAEAILRLLNNGPEAGALGARAKRDIPSGFCIEKMIRETERLYLDIFEKKNFFSSD